MSDVKTVMGQQITREQFEQMKQAMSGGMDDMMDGMDEMMGGGDSDEVKFSPVPAPADIASDDAKKALSLATHGYASHSFDALRVEIDLPAVPNLDLVTAEVVWDGVDAVDRPGPSPIDRKKGVYTCELPCEDGQEAELIPSLKGKLRLSTATKVRKRVFKKDDVGKDQDGWKLTVLDGSKAGLQLPKGTVDPAIVAVDAEGRRLDWQGREEEVMHESGKRPWELEWDDLVEEKMISTCQTTYYGKVAEVHVYEAAERVETENALTVVPTPSGDAAPQGVRFARKRVMRFEDLSEDAIRKGITVELARNSAAMGHGQPMVRVTLPDVDNSAYANVQFGEFNLSGESGDLSDVETETGILDCETHAIDLRFSDPQASDDDATFPALRRIRGEVTVRFPKRVEILQASVADGKDPEGRIRVTTDGPKVTVSWKRDSLPGMRESSASFAPEEFGKVVALHASSLPLVRLPNQGWKGGSEEESVEQGFWGTPDTIEVRHPTDYVDIKVDVDIKVPPPAK